MALALLVLIWLMTLTSTYFFAQSWFPLLASAQARAVDQQIIFNLVLLGTVFILTQAAIGWFIWKHRDEKQSSLPQHNPHGSKRVEILWLGLAAVLFLGLNFFGARTWASHRFIGPSATKDAIRVEVTGEQFRWYFRYPGADGEFGRTRTELQDASMGNPLGIEKTDIAAADDIVSTALVVPAGREVEVTLRAHDVIHSFFIPALRIKQDGVPGMDIKAHFLASETGEYEIVCAELCGIGHHTMNATLKVLPEDEFVRWQAEVAQK